LLEPGPEQRRGGHPEPADHLAVLGVPGEEVDALRLPALAVLDRRHPHRGRAAVDEVRVVGGVDDQPELVLAEEADARPRVLRRPPISGRRRVGWLWLRHWWFPPSPRPRSGAGRSGRSRTPPASPGRCPPRPAPRRRRSPPAGWSRGRT